MCTLTLVPQVSPLFLHDHCMNSKCQGCLGLLGQSWLQLAVTGADIPRGEGQCPCVHMETQLAQLRQHLGNKDKLCSGQVAVGATLASLPAYSPSCGTACASCFFHHVPFWILSPLWAQPVQGGEGSCQALQCGPDCNPEPQSPRKTQGYTGKFCQLFCFF